MSIKRKNIKGLPLNTSYNFGKSYSNLFVDLVVRRLKPNSNNSGLRDTISNPNEIYAGRSAIEGWYNILGLYEASYVKEEKDGENLFERLKYQYITTQGKTHQLPIATSAENAGRGVTIQVTVDSQQLMLIQNKMNELNVDAVTVTIRIPHAILQGVFLAPNGVETVTPTLPSDPSAIDIVEIERYTAQFNGMPSFVPAEYAPGMVKSMVLQAANNNATARSIIAQDRQKLRLSQAAMSSSVLTSPNALSRKLAAAARYLQVSSPSSSRVDIPDSLFQGLASELGLEPAPSESEYNPEEGVADSAASFPSVPEEAAAAAAAEGEVNFDSPM